jgi:hypothetical protein
VVHSGSGECAQIRAGSPFAFLGDSVEDGANLARLQFESELMERRARFVLEAFSSRVHWVGEVITEDEARAVILPFLGLKAEAE